jgi:hypothetical protein
MPANSPIAAAWPYRCSAARISSDCASSEPRMLIDALAPGDAEKVMALPAYAGITAAITPRSSLSRRLQHRSGLPSGVSHGRLARIRRRSLRTACDTPLA